MWGLHPVGRKLAKCPNQGRNPLLDSILCSVLVWGWPTALWARIAGNWEATSMFWHPGKGWLDGSGWEGSCEHPRRGLQKPGTGCPGGTGRLLSGAEIREIGKSAKRPSILEAFLTCAFPGSISVTISHLLLNQSCWGNGVKLREIRGRNGSDVYINICLYYIEYCS